MLLSLPKPLDRMHRTWTRFVSLNPSAIELCSHMREYARLWSVYLSAIVPVEAFMFSYFLYVIMTIRINPWFIAWFSILCVGFLGVMFALTRACALVDKKNGAVAQQNRVLYVRFGKSFPMPVRYLLKVRANLWLFKGLLTRLVFPRRNRCRSPPSSGRTPSSCLPTTASHPRRSTW